MSNPTAMALDPDGSILVAAFRQIHRVDPATGDRELVSAVAWLSAPAVGVGPPLDRPESIVVLESGDLIVADSGQLLHVDLASGDRTLLVEICCGNTFGSISLEDAASIIATSGFSRLVRLGLDGTTLDSLLFLPGSQNPRIRDAIAVPAELPDEDGDGILDPYDVCPDQGDPEQADADDDGVGDACNDSIDRDGDDFADELDVCPDDFDPAQEDRDHDDIGDLCDEFPDDADNDLLRCSADLASCQLDRNALADELDLTQMELDECLSQPPSLPDADSDGEADPTDACPATPTGEPVDAAGCSHAEFCSSIPAQGIKGRLRCLAADWRNDEFRPLPRDCRPNGAGDCLAR
jgi:hypothetical protein